MYCKNCGSLLENGLRFCTQCGSPVTKENPVYQQAPAAPSNQTIPGRPVNSYVPQKPAGRSLKKLFLFGGLALAVLVTVVIIVLSVAGGNGSKLKLGNFTSLGEQTIGSEGGVITLDAPDSSIDGLILTVPGGAYADELEYSISETEIRSHRYGDIFTPITPLITIDNGHGFAETPMFLTIPITLADNEFAMAFFYDKETGLLEGIPTADLSPSSITIMTSHFSDIVVSKVTKSVLAGRIQNNDAVSGFLPKKDDFAAVNWGSYVFPNGHCGGQSISMMHYFTVHSIKASTGSYLRYDKAVDNNDNDETPVFWLDDSMAYRLCSVMQNEYKTNWDANLNQVKSNLWLREDITYYSFAYAIDVTKSPQFIDIRGPDASNTWHAHCMVVYEVTPEGLGIADPNHPGDLFREITATALSTPDQNGSRIDLSGYYAGDNGTSTEFTYNNIAYMGTYALVNFTKANDLWKEVLDGGDAGMNLFPYDELFLTISLDSSGAQQVVDLYYEHTISSKDAAVIDAVNPNAIYITVPVATPGETFTFYRGTEELGTVTSLGNDTSNWAVIQLQSGANDIGVYVKIDGFYVNFYRFSITLGDGTESSSESSSASSSVNESSSPSSSAVLPTATLTPAPTSVPEYDYASALAVWMADFAVAANKTYDDNVSTDTYTLQWVNTPHFENGYIVGAYVLWRHIVYKDGRAEQNYIEVYMYDADAPGLFLSLEELKAAYPQFQH